MKKLLAFVIAAVILTVSLAVPSFAQRTNVSVDALKFTERPEFDGCISEEEWGPMTISVKGSEAATMEDDAVNEFNTYTEFYLEYLRDLFSFDMWLRWDADYFYMGAIVHDPDGFCCPYGGKDLWNGDVFQTRIDPYGPGSAMVALKPDWDYLKDPWDSSLIDFGEALLPESDPNVNPDANLAWVEPTRIINSAFGLVKGLFPQAYNGIEDVIMKDTDVAITTHNTGDGVNTFTCDTTYEIAIPWTTIVHKMLFRRGYEVKEGNVLGISVGVLNSTGMDYNAFIGWGTGIFGGQFKHAPRTVGGSNAVTLSATEVTPAEGFPRYTEPESTEFVPQSVYITETRDPSQMPERKHGGPVDIDTEGGLSTGALVAIIAAAVVVVAGVIIGISASKKKNKGEGEGEEKKEKKSKKDKKKKDEAADTEDKAE